MKPRALGLFSGIGGFELGLERAGFEIAAVCEIDPWCRRVLRKHWPDVPIFEDVRELRADDLPGPIDIITGGFPCQDLSVAGKRRGIEAERSGLWTDLCRLIGEVRPAYAIVENVPGLLSGPSDRRGGWYGRVLGDLAEIRFDAEWHCIPAASLGANHIRDRVWILAVSNAVGCGRRAHDEGAEAAERDGATPTGAADADSARRPRQGGGQLRPTSGPGQFREALADADLGGRPARRGDERGAAGARREDGHDAQRCGRDVPDAHGTELRHGAEREEGRRLDLQAGGQAEPGHDGAAQSLADAAGERLPLGRRILTRGHIADAAASAHQWWLAEPDVGRVVDGFPGRVDQLGALGNAVVPELVEMIGNAIVEHAGW